MSQIEDNPFGQLPPPQIGGSTAKIPPAGTRQKVLRNDAAGNVVAVTEIADGYGGWAVDTSVPPEPYSTKATPPEKPTGKPGSYSMVGNVPVGKYDDQTGATINFDNNDKANALRNLIAQDEAVLADPTWDDANKAKTRAVLKERRQALEDLSPSGDKTPPTPTVSTSAKLIPKWNEQTKVWEWEENRNYTAPQGHAPPAYSGTPAGIADADARERERLALTSKLRMEEDAAQSTLRMQEIEAKDKAERERIIWEIASGLKTTEQGKAELEQIRGMNVADYQTHLKRVLDADEYNRKLPQLQAQEDRAARAEQRERNAPRVAAFKEQAQRGQSTLDTMVNAGIRPGRQLVREAYDPYAHIDRILNEAPAQGPRLQPQAVPTAPTPRPLPAPPQFAPAAPGGPAAVAPAAPLLPEDQDLLRRTPS